MSDFWDLKSLAFRRPLQYVRLAMVEGESQAEGILQEAIEGTLLLWPEEPSGFQPTAEPTGFQPVGGSVPPPTNLSKIV